MCLYQIESLLRLSMGLHFSSRYKSVVKETSVSWAELKFVILRVGMPKHLRTGIGEREKERGGGGVVERGIERNVSMWRSF